MSSTGVPLPCSSTCRRTPPTVTSRLWPPLMPSRLPCRRGLSPLSLLAGRLVHPRRALGPRQRLAELLLGEQLVGLQLLEGARAAGRDAHRRRAGRVGCVEDHHSVVVPEHPVHGVERPTHRIEHLPQRRGPVTGGADHPPPCLA